MALIGMGGIVMQPQTFAGPNEVFPPTNGQYAGDTTRLYPRELGKAFVSVSIYRKGIDILKRVGSVLGLCLMALNGIGAAQSVVPQPQQSSAQSGTHGASQLIESVTRRKTLPLYRSAEPVQYLTHHPLQ
jgi:hypothetical protein